MDNIDNKFIEKGYVPFDLDLINKNTTSDCVLILDDGSFFLGKSFGSKKNVSVKYVSIHPFLVIKRLSQIRLILDKSLILPFLILGI